MSAWQPWVLGGVFLVYLFIAVFRSAYASLSPVALRRILDRDEQDDEGSPFGIRVAFDFAHDVILIVGSLLLISAMDRFGFSHPFLTGAALLVGATVLAQLAGRLIAVASPERAFSATWAVASVVYRPVDMVLSPLFRAMERMRLSSRKERTSEEPEADAEEIEALIDVGESEGIFEAEEGRLIRQVVDFHDRVVREAMTPRTDIVAVPVTSTYEELRELVAREKHSRMPVYRDQIDNIEGIVVLKDLISRWGGPEGDKPITEVLRPAYFVPETMHVADLLRELQARKIQLAIVVDEYGGTAGLVTAEDLLEEIVGEIQEEHDEEEQEITPEAEGRWLVRGSVTIDDFNEALGSDLPEDEGYDTVAGLVYMLLGRIPRAGESVTTHGIKLEVLKADSRRVTLLRAVALAPAGGDARAAG